MLLELKMEATDSLLRVPQMLVSGIFLRLESGLMPVKNYSLVVRFWEVVVTTGLLIVILMLLKLFLVGLCLNGIGLHLL